MHSKYELVFAGGEPHYDLLVLVINTFSSTGGTTSCVIAGRLAAADPSLKILILEAGPHTRGLAEHRQPARFLTHLNSTSKTVTFNQAKPSEHVAGRSVVVSCGRCVGGGSSVNFMMYTRASASDYDDWATVYNNPGWSAKDLIPLLEKVNLFLFSLTIITDQIRRLKPLK
jgi:alcohol oxidase